MVVRDSGAARFSHIEVEMDFTWFFRPRPATASHHMESTTIHASPQLELGISVELIVEARRDPARLPLALISFGAVLGAAALALMLFKGPGGVFLRLHGSSTPACLYYGVLGAVAIFGAAEASFGYWVVPRDVAGWHAAGKTLLWVSLLPLVVVLALSFDGLAWLK